jgi:hypothetical protein
MVKRRKSTQRSLALTQEIDHSLPQSVILLKKVPKAKVPM